MVGNLCNQYNDTYVFKEVQRMLLFIIRCMKNFSYNVIFAVLLGLATLMSDVGVLIYTVLLMITTSFARIVYMIIALFNFSSAVIVSHAVPHIGIGSAIFVSISLIIKGYSIVRNFRLIIAGCLYYMYLAILTIIFFNSYFIYSVLNFKTYLFNEGSAIDYIISWISEIVTSLSIFLTTPSNILFQIIHLPILERLFTIIPVITFIDTDKLIILIMCSVFPIILLTWLNIHGYSSIRAIQIIGKTPIILMSLIVPFMVASVHDRRDFMADIANDINDISV